MTHFVLFCTAGVMAQDDEVITATTPPLRMVEFVRGDMIPTETTDAPGKKHCLGIP